MATTEEFLLTTFGISKEAARDFILANYETNLEEIYNICFTNGVNNDMLADILADVIPGVTGEFIATFFTDKGLNGSALGFNSVVLDNPESLNLLWSLTNTLNAPESALYDEGTDAIYVGNMNSSSSGNNWIDNDGYISKVDTQGNLLELEWATGLNAPKGMAINGSSLYVADLSQIAEISLIDGSIVNTFEAPQGIDHLNDLVYCPCNNTLYVTDSFTDEIYSVDIVTEEFTLFYETETTAEAASQNGILRGKGILYMQGDKNFLKSMSIDIDLDEVTILSDSIDRYIDGITAYGDNFLLSHYGDGLDDSISYFNMETGISEILYTSETEKLADISYSEELDILLVPDFTNNQLLAFEIA